MEVDPGGQIWYKPNHSDSSIKKLLLVLLMHHQQFAAGPSVATISRCTLHLNIYQYCWEVKCHAEIIHNNSRTTVLHWTPLSVLHEEDIIAV